MSIADLTVAERAYLAGLIDGEGCIFIAKWRRRDRPTIIYDLQLIIAQNDEAFLYKWRDRCGIGTVQRSARTSRNKAHKAALANNEGVCIVGYQWRLCSDEAATLLRATLDYLCIKRYQAEIAIAFTQTRIGKHPGRYSVVPQEVLDQRERLHQLLLEAHASHYGGIDSQHGRESPDLTTFPCTTGMFSSTSTSEE